MICLHLHVTLINHNNTLKNFSQHCSTRNYAQTVHQSKTLEVGTLIRWLCGPLQEFLWRAPPFFKPLHLIPMLLISIIDRNPNVCDPSCLDCWRQHLSCRWLLSLDDGNHWTFHHTKKMSHVKFPRVFHQGTRSLPKSRPRHAMGIWSPLSCWPFCYPAFVEEHIVFGNLKQSTRTWKQPIITIIIFGVSNRAGQAALSKDWFIHANILIGGFNPSEKH